MVMIIVKFKTAENNKISIFIAAIFSVLLIVNFLQKEINNRLLAFLGKMSYTLYITHLATIFLFKSILLKMGIIKTSHIDTWYIWIIGVVIAVLTSYLLYFVAESPSKRMLEKVRNQKV